MPQIANKRLFLIFHGRFPSEKAASLFAAKSAEAFAENGFEVTLVVPGRNNIISQDEYDFYNVKRIFKIKRLPVIDLIRDADKQKFGFWISYITFSISLFFYLLGNSSKSDIIYSNETLPLRFASMIRENCFYEMHDFPESKLKLFGKFLLRMKWVLIHNKWKLEEVQKLFPDIGNGKYLYEPNAVELKDFDIGLTKDEARKKLSLSIMDKIIVYTGHLYSWKGVDTLAEAAKFLPNNFQVIFVGGTERDVTSFKEKYGDIQNITLTGNVPHSKVAIWQKAADVLVIPNTMKEKISAYYTSPMKLYEYMASKVPIVASDIPSLREIVTYREACFFVADNPQSLAKAIQDTITNKSNSELMADRAFEKVQEHTWDKRAKRIVNFMKTND